MKDQQPASTLLVASNERAQNDFFLQSKAHELTRALAEFESYAGLLEALSEQETEALRAARHVVRKFTGRN